MFERDGWALLWTQSEPMWHTTCAPRWIVDLRIFFPWNFHFHTQQQCAVSVVYFMYVMIFLKKKNYPPDLGNCLKLFLKKKIIINPPRFRPYS